MLRRTMAAPASEDRLMPLSPSVPRAHLHTRDIRIIGYEREDGLFDI